MTTALVNRGRIHGEAGRLREAVQDLEAVLAARPDTPEAYEQLALVYQRSGRLGEAASVLARGKEAVPHRRCAMSSNLAVVRVLQGNPAGALAELEANLPKVGREQSSACHMVLLHLGRLYRAGGREAEARAMLTRYLEVSASSFDSGTVRGREQARSLLAEGQPR